MSELDLIRQYDRRRRAEFAAWEQAPSTLASPSNPQARGGDEQFGPPAPAPKGIWAGVVESLANDFATARAVVSSLASGRPLAAAGQTAFEVAGQAARNVNQGVTKATLPKPPGMQTPEKFADQTKMALSYKYLALAQTAGGAMQLAAALPAGIGASVQQILKDASPELDAAPLPESLQGVAKYLRTLMMAPDVVLGTAGVDLETLAAHLDEPMTYGEAVNLIGMVAGGGAMAHAAAMRRPGVPATAGAPEVVVQSPRRALPPASYIEFGERVPQPIALGPIIPDPVGRFRPAPVGPAR